MQDRTWNLQFNLDAHNAAYLVLRESSEKADYLDGLTLGINAGSPRNDESKAFLEGFSLGHKFRQETDEYRRLQSEHGKLGGRPRKESSGLPPLDHSLSGAEAMPKLTDSGFPIKDSSTWEKPHVGTRTRERGEDLDDRPGELREAMSVWRELLKTAKSPEVQEQFPQDKRFLAAQVGTTQATWLAWQKHLLNRVQGHPVTHGDLLEAVKTYAASLDRKAKNGISMAIPMLPTMLNRPDFVDAVVHAVKERISKVAPQGEGEENK